MFLYFKGFWPKIVSLQLFPVGSLSIQFPQPFELWGQKGTRKELDEIGIFFKAMCPHFHVECDISLRYIYMLWWIFPCPSTLNNQREQGELILLSCGDSGMSKTLIKQSECTADMTQASQNLNNCAQFFHLNVQNIIHSSRIHATQTWLVFNHVSLIYKCLVWMRFLKT